MKLPVVWLDTETTGLDPKTTEIVEIAAVYRIDKMEEFAPPTWSVPAPNVALVHDVLDSYHVEPSSVGVFYRKVQPVQLGFALEEAMKINGYDAARWEREGQVPAEQMLKELRAWVPYRLHATPWVGGYHVHFDMSFLEALGRKVDRKVPFHRAVEIETLVWERLCPEAGQPIRFTEIAEALKVSQRFGHTALADAIRAMIVGEKLHKMGWFEAFLARRRLHQIGKSKL